MIKISPIISELNPKYYKDDYKYKNLPEYLSKVDKINLIDKNFGVDHYRSNSKEIVDRAMRRRGTTKKDINVSRNLNLQLT